MNKKLIVFFLFIIFSMNLYASKFEIINDYEINDYSKDIISIFESLLEKNLSSLTYLDDDINEKITINFDKLDYNNYLLELEGNLFYNNKSLFFKASFEEPNYNKMKEDLRLILNNFFINDLYKLFSKNEEKIIYSSKKIVSIFNDNKYSQGDLLLLSNRIDNKKTLAQVNTVFDDYSTINYLYKKSSIIDSNIEKGPLNEINLGLSYSIDKYIFGFNIDYLFLKNFITFFDSTYLGLGFKYYNNFNFNMNCAIASDLILNILFPISTIIGNNNLLRNSSIYNKTSIGGLYSSNLSFHSQLEFGIKTYISSKFCISAGYKIDSYDKSNYNFIVNIGYLF